MEKKGYDVHGIESESRADSVLFCKDLMRVQDQKGGSSKRIAIKPICMAKAREWLRPGNHAEVQGPCLRVQVPR